MSKKIKLIVLSLILIVSVASSLWGWHVYPNYIDPNNPGPQREYTRENAAKPFDRGGYKGGHDTIMGEAMLLKKDVHEQTDADGGVDFNNKMAQKALPNLRTGAHDEDSKKWGPFGYVGGEKPIGPNGDGDYTKHFFDRTTGEGWFGSDSAATQAKNYMFRMYNVLGCKELCALPEQEQKKVFDYIGRIGHLLQDMAVPEHHSNNFHGLTGSSVAEEYSPDHWNDIVNSQTFKNKVNASTYNNPDNKYNQVDLKDPKGAIDDLSKVSPMIIYDREDFRKLKCENGFCGAYETDYEKMNNYVASKAAESVLYTAGLIDSAYDKLSKCTGSSSVCPPPVPVAPGGRHPDDRFDVSDGFYYEQELKVSDYDLTNLNLRTALKKGKIGVWYKKLFIDKYAEKMSKLATASQEEIDLINSDLEVLWEKLEQRSSYSESDWKGAPDIALFSYGYYKPSISLMLKYNEPVSFERADFDPGIVEDHPVMLVPSGGFSGLETSVVAKASLDEYVKNGGTLVVFAQQYGKEFGILPVPQELDGTYKTVSGYGWDEDQNCLWNGTYVDTYHQVLSAISQSTVSANVDGYFTSFPSSSSVLLRRTVNGQPAMIMYGYGLGKVIVSSMYSDWAYSNYQATQDEKNIARDMISWAKKPVALPEIKTGETISVPVEIKNVTDTDASSVKLQIYNPDRTAVISEQLLVSGVLAGGSSVVTVEYQTSASSALGIYHIDYILFDSQGNIVQPQTETDSGRFVVSKPAAEYQLSNRLRIWVTSSAEYVLQGSDVAFTIHVKNDTSNDLIGARVGIGSHEARAEGGQYWVYRTAIGDINVPKGEQVDIPWTFTIDKSQSIYFGLFKSDQNPNTYFVRGGIAGPVERWEWVVQHKADISIHTDKSIYAKGEPVAINALVVERTSISSSWQADVKTTITNSRNTKVFESTNTVNIPLSGAGSINASYTLPSNADIGTYTVKSEVWSGSKMLSTASSKFNLPQSQVSVTPNLPAVFNAGANDISFTLSNTGRINVSSGTVEINFKDPDGADVYTGSIPFTLATGESKTLDVPVNIPPLKFGTYVLSWFQSDETRTGQTTSVTIPNGAIFSFSLDKASYRIRETANISINITNTGKFNLDSASGSGLTFTVASADTDYSNTMTVDIGAGQTKTLQSEVQISDAIAAGAHNFNATLTLPSASLASKSTKFNVPVSSLTIAYDGPTTLNAGDTINITIENTGGVDANYSTTQLMLSDSTGKNIYQENLPGSILSGEKKTLANILIPAQTAGGNYYLAINIKNNSTGKTAYISKNLEISGITANLEAITDKPAYMNAETITGLSNIINGQFGIAGASLTVSVLKREEGLFKHFLPKADSGEGWSFSYPTGVAIGSDGSMYVVDSDNSQILKFDGNGNFITKWGSFGTGNGQFSYPSDITAGSDGFVYVADNENNRIQKFDANGNFITKWGSEGTGDGQFYYPYGISAGADGSVYVADTGNNRIQKLDGNGSFVTAWGSEGSGDGQFISPAGIAVSPDGSVYVADNENNRIQKFDGNGNFITKWGSEGSDDGQFYWPLGIAVCSDGFVYVADTENNRIQKFDGNGNFISKWGSYCETDSDGDGVPDQSCDGQFSYPGDIAAGTDGFVYVADSSNSRIQKLSDDGTFIAKWEKSSGIQFGEPTGVAIGHDGFVYVVDNGKKNIQKFDASGNFITEWGSFGSEDGQFNLLYGYIATGPDGSVYVVDSIRFIYSSPEIGRIQKFDSNGNFIAKWGGSFGTGDGQFGGAIGGIVVSPDNSVYVADTSNHRIQKFDSNGNFVTKWGSEGTGDGQFSYPYIAAGNYGFVYVADSGNYRIQKFDANGNFISKLESESVLFTSNHVTIAPDGSVYIGINVEGYCYIKKFDTNGNSIAEWDGNESDVGRFRGLNGITVGSDGSVYAADSVNQRIIKMIPSGGLGKIFETTIPVNQAANASQSYTTDIGVLNATGKLYLNAVLTNSLGQKIAESEYPFYIIEGDTLLLYSTDKKAYKPGETVTISGEVKNLASIDAIGLTFILNSGSAGETAQELYNASFDLPANGSIPFMVTTTADTIGVYTLAGKVVQNSSTLVEIDDLYETANPEVTATITAPDIAGNEAFNIAVSLKNEGKVAAICHISGVSGEMPIVENQIVTIPAKETVILQYSGQISADTSYSFMIAGDATQNMAKTVQYGPGTALEFKDETPLSGRIYPEGKTGIPVHIANTGLTDETISVSYNLTETLATVAELTKTYFIPKGESTSDILYFDLAEGSYRIEARCQYPAADSQADFEVRKENMADMGVDAGQVSGGIIPVTVNLTNAGYNEINGSALLTLINSSNETVWSSTYPVSQLPSTPGNPQSITFDINPSAVPPGNYTLEVKLLDSSMRQISFYSLPISVKGPVIMIGQIPSYNTFAAGDEALFGFTLINTGSQEGTFDFNFKAYDLIDSTQHELLAPGEQREIEFGFMLPNDLEEKDYFADYEMKNGADSEPAQAGSKGQVKYHVSGIDINVTAALDKQKYNEGETARLTLNVASQAQAGLNYFARVNYGDYESQQSFALDGNQTLTFEIPLDRITGEKLFYGIYYESGRSIHLNSLYIYKAGDKLRITADKQVYNPGETVNIQIEGDVSVSGTIVLTAPDYDETFAFSGSASKNFALPSMMKAGTYSVKAELSTSEGESYTTQLMFDVAGIQVTVLDCNNDKAKYASTDIITTGFVITSNKAIPATLKTWVVDPEGNYTQDGEIGINLLPSENVIATYASLLVTGRSGIHQVVYGIYADDLLLVSGSETFDVGDAVLLGLSSDKTDYQASNETVNILVSAFGTVNANLELVLDGRTVVSDSVSLNGFKKLSYPLANINPGYHKLKCVLLAGGLTSEKETGFVYGSSLPDLIAGIKPRSGEAGQENLVEFTATITNQGRILSDATTVSFYDGDTLIENKPLKVLNKAESDEISIGWSVMGKAGEHIIKAYADPGNTVAEFNEDNNTASFNLLIPDVSLVTTTDKDTYKIRQTVNIASKIINLTSSAIYQNLAVLTSVKDPAGAQIYSSSSTVSTVSPGQSTVHTLVWDTAGLQTEGIYTISQTIKSGEQILNDSSTKVNLLTAADFAIAADSVYRKINRGENATYLIYLTPVDGWNAAVAIGVDELPVGTLVTFAPGNIVPPGESFVMTITTAATTLGIHTLNLKAWGSDGSETVEHILPLTLDVSGFEIIADKTDLTLKQLETDRVHIDINAANGYEGSINLAVEGVPPGMKADLDNSAMIRAPGHVILSILTSKNVKPGSYEIKLTGDDGLVKQQTIITVNILKNPEISPGIITSQGPGLLNEAWVRVFNQKLEPVLELMAFNTKFGANTVSADIDGDGYDEIIVSEGPGPNNSATLKAFKRDGTFITEYTAFNTKSGLTIASCDIDGDWKDEIIAGTGPGLLNPAAIKILKYNGSGFADMVGPKLVSLTLLGVNVATGDVDGDGKPEIITAPGPALFNPAIIKVWKFENGDLTELYDFKAFDNKFYGVNIAIKDLDGDGIAEIIAGAGSGLINEALVKVFKGDGTPAGVEFNAYPNTHNGVQVAAGDVNGDGTAEIITGIGPGLLNTSWVKIFSPDGTELTGFLAYPNNIRFGVKVSAGNMGE